MADRPAAEVAIDEVLVRDLLRSQHPDLAELPLALVDEGWDNAVWRLGDHLAVRLPRRAMAAPLVRHEQEWLPVLGPALPVPVPVPARVGVPQGGYPWHWSVVPWFEGRHAIDLPVERTASLVEPLADLVIALHVPAPANHPVNPVRGVPLAARDAVVRERLRTVPALGPEAWGIWADAVAAPRWAAAPRWIHGDLHPGNLVVGDDGSLAAVVDFGDMCAGDPATDLAVAWMLFDAAGRQRFVDKVESACGWGAPTWRRAHGWAVSFASVLLESSDDNPAYLALGRRTLAAALAPPPVVRQQTAPVGD